MALADWSDSSTDNAQYYQHILNDVLEITEPCKKTTNELQNAGKFVPWYLKPFMYATVPLHWNASKERLPERARQLYGLQSTSLSRGVDYSFMTYVTWTYPYLPDSMRRFQVNHYMSKAEALMTKGRLA